MTPEGWTRASAYLMAGPRLSPSGSPTSRLKEIVVCQALMMHKDEEVMRNMAVCRAMLAGGEQDPKIRADLEKGFWKSWRAYMQTVFPFDETLKKEEAEKMREYMDKHMDTQPFVITPMRPPKRKMPNVKEVMPRVRKRTPRRR